MSRGKNDLPHINVLRQWSQEDVINWLQKIGYRDCISCFEANTIDGYKLGELTELDLTRMQPAVPRSKRKDLYRYISKIDKTRQLPNENNNELKDYFSKTRPQIGSDDEHSDGWGSDEWDDDPGEEDYENWQENGQIAQDAEEDEDSGDYMEPEDMTAPPRPSAGRRPVPQAVPPRQAKASPSPRPGVPQVKAESPPPRPRVTVESPPPRPPGRGNGAAPKKTLPSKPKPPESSSEDEYIDPDMPVKPAKKVMPAPPSGNRVPAAPPPAKQAPTTRWQQPIPKPAPLPPDSDNEEEYEDPDQIAKPISDELYEECDDRPAVRSGPNRVLPPVPSPASKASVPGANIPPVPTSAKPNSSAPAHRTPPPKPATTAKPKGKEMGGMALVSGINSTALRGVKLKKVNDAIDAKNNDPEIKDNPNKKAGMNTLINRFNAQTSTKRPALNISRQQSDESGSSQKSVPSSDSEGSASGMVSGQRSLPPPLPPTTNRKKSADNTKPGAIANELLATNAPKLRGKKTPLPEPIPVPDAAPPLPPVTKLPPRKTPESTNRDRKLPSPPKKDEMERLYSYPWYFGDITRVEADKKLRTLNQDSTFLIRKSLKGAAEYPYTMAVWYMNNIYNLRIRQRSDNKYAIGTIKEDENTFKTIPELVDFHTRSAIVLAPDKEHGKVGGKTILKKSPKK